MKEKSQGFTLVEILFAIAIFTSGMIAVMYLFPMGTRDVGRAKLLTISTNFGQALMEEAIYQPAEDAPISASGTFTPDYPDMYYNVVKAPLSVCTSLYQISVEIYNGNPASGAKSLIRLDTLKGIGTRE